MTADPVSDVEGKVVIVTGASKGVGRGIAVEHPVQDGRISAGVERADASRTKRVLRPIRAADHGIVFLLLYRHRFAGHHRFVDGRSDVSDRDLNTVFDTGHKGTLWGMQAVFPHMRDQGWGRIVTMGSNAALTGASGYGPYSASKEAIRSLTRTAAREWGQYGIVVNCVCPVSVAHRMPPGEDPDRAAVFAQTFASQPIARDGDAIEDIGPIVAFLLSDACRYLTGQTFMADGGALLRP